MTVLKERYLMPKKSRFELFIVSISVDLTLSDPIGSTFFSKELSDLQAFYNENRMKKKFNGDFIFDGIISDENNIFLVEKIFFDENY